MTSPLHTARSAPLDGAQRMSPGSTRLQFEECVRKCQRSNLFLAMNASSLSLD
jgi:hypothetical protein